MKMLNLRTILAPVDFSERTEFEARNAADIAGRFGSRLIFLHVITSFAETVPTDPAAAEAYSREFSSEIEKGVTEALSALASRVAGDVEVECVVLSGSPEEKIGEFAKSRDVSLIVMPTTGNGRVRRQLLGSVTARMLQDLVCPLLTGTADWEAKPDQKTLYRKIACTVEPGEQASERLRWARDFAAAYDGSLFVVGVLPFLDSVGATPSLPEHLRGQAMEDAKQQLQVLCEQESVEAEIVVLGGPIDQMLPAFVDANEIDLLVSGRRRYQDTVGAFGIHTDILDTVQSVPCPMVLI